MARTGTIRVEIDAARPGALTEGEVAIVNQLDDAAAVMFTLESDPAEREEFERAIRAAQSAVLARPGRRQYRRHATARTSEP